MLAHRTGPAQTGGMRPISAEACSVPGAGVPALFRTRSHLKGSRAGSFPGDSGRREIAQTCSGLPPRAAPRASLSEASRADESATPGAGTGGQLPRGACLILQRLGFHKRAHVGNQNPAKELLNHIEILSRKVQARQIQTLLPCVDCAVGKASVALGFRY